MLSTVFVRRRCCWFPCLSSIALLLATLPAHSADKCQALEALPIPGGRVVSAKLETPPFDTPAFHSANFDKRLKALNPNTPPPGHSIVTVGFCRVIGLLRPTPSSQVTFEVWMPTERYSRRLAGLGNGGFAGFINYTLLAQLINRGYAVFGNDRGHRGDPTEADWAIGQPEKVTDYRWRGTHVATVASKAIVAEYYGVAANRSYFYGCSGGGMQAYAAARMSPEDFDGIIGADTDVTSGTAHDGTNPLGSKVTITRATSSAPGSPSIERLNHALDELTLAQLQTISRAALAKCDALDGVKDGAIADASACQFDPGTLQCRATEASGCLTAVQVEAVKGAYVTGYAPGSEYYWRAVQTAAAPVEPYRDLNVVSQARVEAIAPGQRFMQEYAKSGHKFIAYVGANSPFSLYMRRYQEAMVADLQRQGRSHAQAEADLARYYRFFSIPGGEHCYGGAGANNISGLYQPQRPAMGPEQDVISAMEDWVERGRLPDYLVATKYQDDRPSERVVETGLLCPYPKTSKWNGSGDPFDYHSFRCGDFAR